jgi:hypothetical protein
MTSVQEHPHLNAVILNEHEQREDELMDLWLFFRFPAI